MKRTLIGSCVLALLMVQGSLFAQPVTDVQVLPPYVVKTVPANRAVDVAANLTEIKVTFDRPMKTEKAWSWIIYTDIGVYPGIKGGPDPRWEDEGKICVLAVKLQPGMVYAVGVNSFRHNGFRDTKDTVVVPYVLVFKTAGERAQAVPVPAQTAPDADHHQ